MGSWSFDLVGKGFVSDESKSPFMFGNNMIGSANETSIENQGFGEMCFPQFVGNSLFSSPVMAATHYAFFEENESSSKLSSSVVESNSRDSDLNLNRIVNQEIPTSSKITNNSSSSQVSMPSKPTRIAGSPSPFCQVLGCNKSLVSSKDYHKRHKVCEIHSKTAKVIVKGVEQRFCQQCSRFHLLSDFDDGKRSCRKRLADHNERRRKPRHSGRHGRLLPSYPAGGKFKGPTRTRDTSSSMYHDDDDDDDDIWHIKLEDEMANDLRSISSMTQLHSESVSSGNLGQQYPSLRDDCNGYAQPSISFFFPIFDKNPTSDFITMDPAPMASDSWSALSLLSSQSQGDFLCHSSRNSMPSSHPLMIQFNHIGHHRAFGVSNNMNPLVGCEDMNPSNRAWSGDGSTIGLLQLSSELERVEHKKEIVGTNGGSFGLSMT